MGFPSGPVPFMSVVRKCSANSGTSPVPAAARALASADFGCRTFASTAGLRGYPYVSAYVAAKHAVVGFTRALAIEVEKKGVTVNAVCPGFTDTELTRASAAAVAERTGKAIDEIIASYAATNAHGRLVRPDEVANGVAWFCLPDQSAVSGRAVAIDGSDEKPEV